MATKSPVYIIIPVHNRKTTTLACLEHLNQLGDLTQFQIIVVDDGSTDGTEAAIASQFPQVTVLRGNGHLWWAGAIVRGMQYAYEQGAAYFVWLNDDTLPLEGAIATLVQVCQQHPQRIVTAQCYAAADLQTPTYSGHLKQGLRHVPIHAAIDQLIPCDTICGNLACLPRSIVDAIGFPPHEKLPHYQADCLYSWQAKQAGYEVLIVGSAIALCAHNPGDTSWLTSEVPIAARWRSVRSPKSPFYIPGYWHFCINFWGACGILVFVQPYLRLFVIGLLRWILPPDRRSWLKVRLQTLKASTSLK